MASQIKPGDETFRMKLMTPILVCFTVGYRRLRLESYEGECPGENSAMLSAAESSERCELPAYGNMEIGGGTKKSDSTTTYCLNLSSFSHFLFSVYSMFRTSSIFDSDLHSLRTVSWSLRDVLSMICEISASTISMFRHSLSPSEIHSFKQNLEDLAMFNLDLFYQNELNTPGSYLKDFGADLEILRQHRSLFGRQTP